MGWQTKHRRIQTLDLDGQTYLLMSGPNAGLLLPAVRSTSSTRRVASLTGRPTVATTPVFKASGSTQRGRRRSRWKRPAGSLQVLDRVGNGGTIHASEKRVGHSFQPFGP